MIFQTDNHGVTARVDVYTTGEVYWIAGGAQVPWLPWPWNSGAKFQLQQVFCCPKDWVSLSGIVFATGNGGAVVYPLALQNGWAHYGDPFAPPQYFLSDGICSLQGLISGDPIDLK